MPTTTAPVRAHHKDTKAQSPPTQPWNQGEGEHGNPEVGFSGPHSIGLLRVFVSLWFRFRALAVAVTVTLVLAVAAADARLAVFVDGRVMRVEDAVLEGDAIVLTLPEGGEMVVPAGRIERVIADEVVEPGPPPPPPGCPPGWAPEPLPEWLPFRAEIEAAAEAADLHPWLLAALVQAESGFDPRAESRAGARGLTQLMPAAAADHGVSDVWDPAENLRGGAAHLRRMLDRFGSLSLALAAYNAGATVVARAGGVPPYRETRGFVRRVGGQFCPPDPRNPDTLREQGDLP